MRITVLSPHRDDAAFSVGLAMDTWLHAGHSVEIVNCFTESEHEPFSAPEMARPAGRRARVTALRHDEDIAWTKFYNHPVDLIDLKLVDAPERIGCSIDEVCLRPVDRNDPSLAQVRRALEKGTPECLLLPLAIGHHVDHLTARIAAQDGWPASLPMAFYEDLPYAARPRAAAGIGRLARGVCGHLCATFVRTKTDSIAALERKRELALCYGSQIDGDVAEQIAGFCKRYGGRERLWANRAWMDAGMGVSD